MQAGYGLLRPDRQGFIAADLKGNNLIPGHRFVPGKDDWQMCSNMVIDCSEQRPVTSDYDLAAVVDTSHFSYELTYMSMAEYANRTNYWTDSISSELNHRFGSRRIMHVSEAQWSGGLANKEGDSAVVFHPTGDVMICEDLQIGSGDHRTHGDLILLDIIKLYFPKQVLTH